MKKTFGKVLVALLVSVAFIGLVGCNNNADSGGGGGGSSGGSSTPSASLMVMGTYESGGDIITFNYDGTGTYPTGNPSANIRAASSDISPTFTWTASGSGSSFTITITTANGNIITISLVDGTLKLDDKDFDLQLLTTNDALGIWNLQKPDTNSLNSKLRNGTLVWYPVSVTFNTGNRGSAKVHYLESGRVESADRGGTWSIINLGQLNAGCITLQGDYPYSSYFADSIIKLNPDKNKCYVWNQYAGEMIYTK